MKAKLWFLWCVGVLAFILLAAIGRADILSWDPATTYTDGTDIPSADQAGLLYAAYWGASPSSWNFIGQTSATAIVAPIPPAGITWYYCLESTLNGQTGPKSPAYAYTTPIPAPPVPVAPMPPSGVKVTAGPQ